MGAPSVKNGDDTVVTGLSYDSRRALAGHVFFCKGGSFLPVYAKRASEKGCVCIVYSEETESVVEIKTECVKVRVENVRRAMALCAAHFYGYPMDKLISVAVTGTKGKTTVTGYINEALNRVNGFRSVILSKTVSESAPRLTTPEAIDLHCAAAKAVKLGCTHIVCEISSQAQKLERTYGISFDIGCFTNFGRDHISKSEHVDESEYFSCKRSVLKQCKRAVINVDDEKGGELLCEMKGNAVSVSLIDRNADYYGENMCFEDHGCDLSVARRSKKAFPIVAYGIGEFCAMNALCATAVAMECGADKRAVFEGIISQKTEGRGEITVSADGKIIVIVDYAHNEMSFKAMLDAVKKEYPGAVVTVIFGCPGDKASCRRRQLVAAVSDRADKVTVCEDDSGSEGYEAIKNEMRGHFEELLSEGARRLSPASVSYIEDRKVALESALENASDNDMRHVILLLGKGSECFNRGYGCDEACVSDVVLAKNAIEEYDRKAKLKETFLSLGLAEKSRVLICVARDTGVSLELASSLEYVIGRAEVYALCDRLCADMLKENCFARGIAATELFENKNGYGINLAIGAAKSGILPIFVAKDKKRAVSALAGAMNFEHIVYLESGEGIIFKDKIAVGSLSLRRAKIVLSALPSPTADRLISVFEHGVKSVAVLNGRRADALASFLLGGAASGTVIRSG